jgi:hypothetical protein
VLVLGWHYVFRGLKIREKIPGLESDIFLIFSATIGDLASIHILVPSTKPQEIRRN